MQAQAGVSDKPAHPTAEADLSGPVLNAVYVYNVLLVGETGSGKTTLLNMLVNYFRGKPEARTKLPDKQDLKLAVPTAYLKATEPEGAHQSERDVSDSKRSPDHNGIICLCCPTLFLHR